jgi:WD40 repeat protein
MKTSARFLRARKLALLVVVALALPGTVHARPPQKPAAGRFAAVAFSPDGKTLAAANTSGVIQLWDTTKGTPVGTLTDLQTLVRLAFSPDGKSLVATSWEGGATLWDVPTASIRAVLKGHTDVIEGVAFSADGKTLATASWDETVKLWDVESARCKQTIQGPGTQRAVALSPDGKTLAVGTFNSLRVLELVSGKVLFTIEDTNDVLAVDFSPDGKTLLMGYSGTEGCTVGLLDLATKKERVSVKAHEARAGCVKFSADGKQFATAGDSPAVQVWDARSGKQVMALEGHTRSTFAVAFSSDGAPLASSGALLDVGAMSGVAISPDGKTLATGSWEGTVTLWDVNSGRERATLKAHEEVACSVAFSPDGKRLVTGGWDHSVKVWDVATGKEVLTLKGDSRIYCVAFSPDGKVLAGGTRDRMARLWDAETGKELAALPHAMHVFSVVFSPVESTLATAARPNAQSPNTVRIWDTAKGRELVVINGHRDGSALFVGFSADGSCLASAGSDGTVKLWASATGKELAAFDSDVASILYRVGPNATAAFPALMSALGDADLGARRKLTEKFWSNKMDQQVLVSALAEALRHEHAVIRAGAADALAQLGPAAKAAVPLLLELTKDKSKVAREAAAAALEKIDPEAAKKASRP